MQQFFIKKFFNPNGGPATNPEAIKEQTDKPQTTADVMKDFPKDQNDKFHYIEAKDKGVTAGKETQVGQLNVVGQNIDKHNEHRGEVQKQVESQIADPETPEDLKQWLKDKVQQTKEGKNKAVARSRMEQKYVEKSVDTDIDASGNLSLKSLKDYIADFDMDGDVEIEDTNWFISWWKWTSRFKEMFSEQQIRNVMSGASKEEINELYQRLTWDASWFDLKAKKEVYTRENKNSGEERIYTEVKMDGASKEKLKKFQDALKTRIADVAALASIYSADMSVSTGLSAVVNWTEEQLFSYLEDPANSEKLHKILKEGAISEGNTKAWEKVLGIVTKLGLSATVGVLSKGLVSFRHQVTENKIPKNGSGKASVNLENMSAKVGVGDKWSIGVDVDIAAAVLELNINDHSQIISNADRIYQSSENKKEAVSKVVDYAQKVYDKGWKGKNTEAFNKLTSDYQKTQEKILWLSNLTPEQQKAQQSHLDSNTHLYISKVLQLGKMDLKGWYLNASFLGGELTAGIQWQETNVSYTEKWTNKNSAEIEKQATKNIDASERQIFDIFDEMNIPKDKEGNYIIDGKSVKAPEWHKIQWDVEIVYDVSWKSIDVWYQFVDASAKVESKVVKIDINNPEYRNKYIQEHSADIAKELLNMRKNSGFSDVQREISQENYDAAKIKLEWFLDKQLKWKITADQKALYTWMKAELANANGQNLAEFMDSILAKTSGWEKSRGYADEILKWNNIKWKLVDYYNNTGVAEKFAGLYGINKADVMELANVLFDSAHKDSISSIGQHAKSGFTALVWFSQRNGFRQLDKVRNSNAQIIGTPKTIGGEQAEKIRAKLQSSIGEADLNQIRQNNKIPETISNEELKKLLTSGQVKAYLSFEPDAECFNLGFFVEPGTRTETSETPVVIKNSLSQWTNMMKALSTTVTTGIGIGIKTKDSETPPEKKEPEPKKAENTSTAWATDTIKDDGGIGQSAVEIKAASATAPDVTVNATTPIDINTVKPNVGKIEDSNDYI